LPLLGLIPIIGRLFTAPTKDNRQVDIVIAVTPRVIRAPAILPEDEIERPTGSLRADQRFARSDDYSGRTRRTACRRASFADGRARFNCPIKKPRRAGLC
jgi:type II secretory pathway component GspD/PulD (secretin)